MKLTSVGLAPGILGALDRSTVLLARGSASALEGLGWERVSSFVSFLTWELPPLHLGFQQSMRENKEKQALSDLMIKPVQRIPRYELLVKVGVDWLDREAWRRSTSVLRLVPCSSSQFRVPLPPQDLLKHTPEDHPDHPLLLDAQRHIKQVAERINKGVRSAEEAERHARVLQEIEAHIEGMEDVRAPPCCALPRPVCVCACHPDCGRPRPGLWSACFCDHSAPPFCALLLLLCLTLSLARQHSDSREGRMLLWLTLSIEWANRSLQG